MNQENTAATSTPNAVARINPVAQQSDVMEIDLAELGLMLLDNLHHIVLFFLLGAVLFNAYSYFLIHPTYESTASIYVVSASGGSVVDLSLIHI